MKRAPYTFSGDLSVVLTVAGIDIVCVAAIGTAYFISQASGLSLIFPAGIIVSLRLYDKLNMAFTKNL